MSSIIAIFLLAYGSTGLAHVVNTDGETRGEDVNKFSAIIVAGAWILAVARLVSLAQYPQ